MVDPKYLHPGLPFALAHFIEECGEALAAAGKCQRWGMESVNPELPPTLQETNRQWLLRELEDLDGAITRLRHEADHAIAGIRAKETTADQAMNVSELERLIAAYETTTGIDQDDTIDQIATWALQSGRQIIQSLSTLRQRIEALEAVLPACREIIARELRILLESCCLLDKNLEPIRETFDGGPSDDLIQMEETLAAIDAMVARQAAGERGE